LRNIGQTGAWVVRVSHRIEALKTSPSPGLGPGGHVFEIGILETKTWIAGSSSAKGLRA
jgi:hypothetical protein